MYRKGNYEDCLKFIEDVLNIHLLDFQKELIKAHFENRIVVGGRGIGRTMCRNAYCKYIESLTIEIEWSSGRRSMGAYQTKAIGHAFYKNGTSDYYETSYTGGCGYDKPSTSTAEVCDKLAKIVLLKHYSKIQKDTEKHYHFYAAENGYYQHSVGMSSYTTFFKNCGYKVKELYHHNENITLLISK